MANQEQTKSKADSQELSDDQLKAVAGGVSSPPSGDANPSDLTNSTVDTSDVINPHPQA